MFKSCGSDNDIEDNNVDDDDDDACHLKVSVANKAKGLARHS